MEKLTLLLLALFVSASLYGGEIFTGKVSINLKGEVTEQMISLLESENPLELLKDSADYITFPVTLKEGKKGWTYEDSEMKITYKPKNKKFTLTLKKACLTPATGNEETSESAKMSKGKLKCSGTMTEDITPNLEQGTPIGLTDHYLDQLLWSQSWKLQKKGKNWILKEKDTERVVSVKITPKNKTAKCILKVSGHWISPMLFHPN